MHILLLAGGNSNERDVSLRSGKAVAEAIRELGHELTELDPGVEGFDIAKHIEGIDVVFPALHGQGGEDGDLQEKLEGLGVTFVGSGSQASRICWNKWQYKELLRKNNLPVSEGTLLTITGYNENPEVYNQPFVLKPVEGGSSLDTIIARTPTEEDWSTVTRLLNTYQTGMLYEPIIEGTEITVGILDNEPLPVIEIVPPEGLEFDYENKYNGATRELCPPETVSQELQKQAQDLALLIHQLTGCRHMSRTDIIIDKQGTLHVLETNTLPGMTTTSLLPKMAQTAGYSMPQLVEKLIKLATA